MSKNNKQESNPMFHKFKQRLRTYFLTGFIVIVPVIVSIKVLVWLMTSIDGVLRPFLEDVFKEYIFGFGIILMLVIVMMVGVLAQNYFGKKLVRLVAAIFDRVPFIRTIYSVVRQLIELLSSEKGNAFKHVVMVEYPMKGRFAIGLIANEHAGSRHGENLVTVFLPTNHLYLGFMAIIPESEVVRLDLSVEEALKTVASCGIVLPKTLDT
jgi:uncharacterized membrane protein